MPSPVLEMPRLRQQYFWRRRGWVIVGLALAAWLVVLAIGFGLWALLT